MELKVVDGDLLNQDVEVIVNLLWMSSERAIRDSARNALAQAKGYRSVAFPVIGAGAGGASAERSLQFMKDEAMKSSFVGEVRIVRFKP